MAEYIEREALMEYADSQPGGLISNKSIQFFPSADVAPVRHGKWIQGKGNYVTCSLCGAGTTAESAADDGEPYCFNCGARMDGEV